MSDNFAQNLIKLGATNPELRPHIRQVLAKISGKIPPDLNQNLRKFQMELASWIEPSMAKDFIEELKYNLMNSANQDSQKVDDLLWQTAKTILGWRMGRDQKDLEEMSEIWREIR